MDKITPEEFANRMRELKSGDEELDHSRADDLMCSVLNSLGYGEGVSVFEAMDKWYA